MDDKTLFKRMGVALIACSVLFGMVSVLSLLAALTESSRQTAYFGSSMVVAMLPCVMMAIAGSIITWRSSK